MIHLKTKEEIELIRKSALLVSKTLGLMAELLEPGITTLELDKKAEEFIRDNGGEPGFLGLYDFPNTLCMSPNEQVVHGFPNKTPLKEGDIISIDCGVKMNGFYGDHAYTFAVGEVKPEIEQLLKVTKESLYLGIEECKAGNRIGDIGFAIQHHAEKHGYGVVRELVGHGLGRKMHESPEVPNYGKRGRGAKLKDGLVLAIEPMINLGGRSIKQLADGWSIVTADGRYSAHFEHDVAIVDGKPDILSTFDFVEEALKKKGLAIY
ncbi:type I methionyl aminopeptidase [Marivirga arenosa]|uniref:Methionine aminopeptidase n=1 Tax=Marivirga arenosa TaxID=3059076 RepID=A0AA51ZVE3_9BACT|nr:type I methionyl aminopeptidase [Marivirga sp. BKB1-2]WNB17464.1 type I methionyl aminopeptidase [Marivirga sp. BKB1-2]